MSEKQLAEDGKPGCPVTVWDGPYSMRCSLGAAVGKCAYHGEFVNPPTPTPDPARHPTGSGVRGRDDRRQVMGEDVRQFAEIDALRAEVEHWKAHAEEAGRGFGAVCERYAAALARITAAREYVEDPGNWSAFDSRRRLLLDLLSGEDPRKPPRCICKRDDPHMPCRGDVDGSCRPCAERIAADPDAYCLADPEHDDPAIPPARTEADDA